jgi:hypothetical protein
MENTMLIQLTNQKAAKLLYELEELHLIKVLKGKAEPEKRSLSSKYRGTFSLNDGIQLSEHVKQMREEWDNI